MTGERTIRVLIVDDHAMVRSGLRFFLLSMPDVTLIGEASNGREAVELCKRLKPDVALMDLVMPEMDGIEAIRALRQRQPNVRMLALSSFQEAMRVQEALRAGAIGYLLKDVTADELGAAIRGAFSGRRSLSPEVAGALAEATAGALADTELTDRQLEVLRLLVAGMSNAEIARELTITVATARFHVSSILFRLGAANRAEAAALAVKRGLIDQDQLRLERGGNPCSGLPPLSFLGSCRTGHSSSTRTIHMPGVQAMVRRYTFLESEWGAVRGSEVTDGSRRGPRRKIHTSEESSNESRSYRRTRSDRHRYAVPVR